MPGVDWIPGVAHLKMACQLVTGDIKGAAATNANFCQECPIVSQVTSLALLAIGEKEAALDAQKKCLGTINNVANGIPVVGHVKGAIHHLAGDHEGGDQALNAATRTTVVMGSGAAAAIATGGLGAIPAGIAAGAAYDAVDTAISDKPKGLMAAVDNVVNNPNAGNIFDAAAGIVGDGLTGYAGGNIAKNVAKNVKINKLEASRAAKADQLNAGLFGEEASTGGSGGGGGGGGSMTSGQLASLGDQINALTSQIDALKVKTPQYFWDPKTKQVVIEYPNASGGGPVIPAPNQEARQGTNNSGRDENNNEFIPSETGIQADIYVDTEVVEALTPQQRSARVNCYQNQQPGTRPLPSGRVRLMNNPDYNRMIQDRGDAPQPGITRQEMDLLALTHLLHLRMPPRFGYTGAGHLNDPRLGFLHTFVRHYDQWLGYIPELGQVMNRLSPIRTQLDSVRLATNAAASTAAINALNVAINQLNHSDYIVVRTNLLRAQLLIHQFMQRNLTMGQYEGEGVNESQQMQVYFRMPNGEVMVIGISDELAPPIREFGDSRPVRFVVTVYFITAADFLRLLFRVRRVW